MKDQGTKKSTACPTCSIAQKDQHSLRESGRCDGIRKGYLAPVTPKAGRS